MRLLKSKVHQPLTVNVNSNNNTNSNNTTAILQEPRPILKTNITAKEKYIRELGRKQENLVARIKFTKDILDYQQNKIDAQELIERTDLEESMHHKGMIGIAGAQTLNISREVFGMLGEWLKLEIDLRRLMGRYIDDKEMERFFEA